MSRHNCVLLVFGNQLFDPVHLQGRWPKNQPDSRPLVLMVEDDAFCRRYRWHRQKLTFVLSAMRSHADCLRRAGFEVRYYQLEDGRTWRSALAALAGEGYGRVYHFALENRALATAVSAHAGTLDMTVETLPTPMFINTLDDFASHLEAHAAPSLLPYYQAQRQRHDILISADGTPVGGRWSFDQDNRRKLPRDVEPPPLTAPPATAHTADVVDLVRRRFPDHPGRLEGHLAGPPEGAAGSGEASAPAGQLWLPTTHDQAQAWFQEFLDTRFEHFGTYEDALTQRSQVVYHSVLAPLLNVGLLTPGDVLEQALRHAAEHNVALNSVEGLVRQILGWREFVRGVYHHYAEPLTSRNIWDGDRRLSDHWYDGTTGIVPLDLVIGKANDLGWAHHIERLMVAANLMNLAGIRPQDVYRWFMEMFVDAYDWVMVPNVFGMGLTSDGGIFTTKPYICGSNYILKMGDYPRGDWCDVMDGLLWRFVANHEAKLRANQRLAPMVANLPRVSRRRPEIFDLADEFIETKTLAA